MTVFFVLHLLAFSVAAAGCQGGIEARESRGGGAARLTVAATALCFSNLGLRRYGRGGDCCVPLLIDLHAREASLLTPNGKPPAPGCCSAPLLCEGLLPGASD